MDAMVCEGVPFMEINRKAMEFHAEMIVIGSCGNAGDMKTILVRFRHGTGVSAHVFRVYGLAP